MAVPENPGYAYDSAARASENARGRLPIIERETEIVRAISVRRRREKVCSWFLDVADEWVNLSGALPAQ